MNVVAQRLEPFLVRHPEMLLLVDNHEAQLLELDRFRQQCVGADDDVDNAVFDALAGALGFGRRDQPRQSPDFDREALKARDEGRIMLAREQGGRADQRDLVSGHRGDERGAQRDLGLAEADIAAHQPVHRLAAGQILEHLADRAILVLGFLIGEAVDELRIGRIGFEQSPGAGRADRGGLDQHAGNLADALLHPALAPLPCFAAEAVEHGALAVAAIAGKHVDILDRDVELVAAGIAERDAIMRRLADHD